MLRSGARPMPGVAPLPPPQAPSIVTSATAASAHRLFHRRMYVLLRLVRTPRYGLTLPGSGEGWLSKPRAHGRVTQGHASAAIIRGVIPGLFPAGARPFRW